VFCFLFAIRLTIVLPTASHRSYFHAVRACACGLTARGNSDHPSDDNEDTTDTMGNICSSCCTSSWNRTSSASAEANWSQASRRMDSMIMRLPKVSGKLWQSCLDTLKTSVNASKHTAIHHSRTCREQKSTFFPARHYKH